jgi:hypothetical protein
MLVTNPKGQICHITSALAEMLGRTRSQVMSMSGSNVVEQLMVRPFAQMHRERLQVRRGWWPPTVVMPCVGLSLLSVAHDWPVRVYSLRAMATCRASWLLSSRSTAVGRGLQFCCRVRMRKASQLCSPVVWASQRKS